MNDKKIKVITDKEELHNICKNMEELFGKYYLPLLDIHYRKIYQLQNRIKELEQINEEHRKINGQIRENWDCFKEWLEKRLKDYNESIAEGFDDFDFKYECEAILDKMNELEGIDNNDSQRNV